MELIITLIVLSVCTVAVINAMEHNDRFKF